MPLAAGARVGQYQILSLLAAPRASGLPDYRHLEVVPRRGPVSGGQFDPSGADTSAEFRAACSTACGRSDVGWSSAGATTSCPCADNGIFTIRARVLDKDDGFTEYSNQRLTSVSWLLLDAHSSP